MMNMSVSMDTPCDYCKHAKKCRDLSMACRAFMDFAKRGRIFGTYLSKHTSVPIIVNGQYDTTLEAVIKNVTPNRKNYLQLFGAGESQ